VRITTARQQVEMLSPWRTAGERPALQFDWRRSPEYDSEYSMEHHSAPLENGDRLHVFHVPWVRVGDPDNGKRSWWYELEGHHQTPRFPIQPNPDLKQPQFPFNHVIQAVPRGNPAREDVVSRYNSAKPSGGRYAWKTKEQAMQQAQAVYQRVLDGPWRDREPRRSSFDYDEYFKPGGLDDFDGGPK
jgi:hypothetical protein